MWDSVKTICVVVISAVCAYLEPIQHVVQLLFLLAGIDILVGIITAVAIDGERFKFKKFILAAVYVLIYLGVAALIYTVGRLQGDYNEMMVVVKMVTYVFIYFYIANVLKNLRKLLPTNKVIAFLDFVIGLEFAKRIPQLGKFLDKDSKPEKPNDNGCNDNEKI